MEADSSDQFRYTFRGAELYGALGIEGTSYEIGFEAVRLALGDIQGRVLLDCGCGTGRSAAFLKSLGAGRVYGVDRDQDMIDGALAQRLTNAVFMRIDEVIPLPDEPFPASFSPPRRPRRARYAPVQHSVMPKRECFAWHGCQYAGGYCPVWRDSRTRT